MKLDIWIGSLGRGGTEGHLAKILPPLQDLGWKIRLFTHSNELALASCFTKHNIPIYSPKAWLQLKFFPRPISRIILLINNFLRLCYFFYKVDKKTIVHFYLPQSYVLGMLAALVTRSKNILLMSRRSMNNYQDRTIFTRPLEKILHNFTTVIFVNSKAVLKQLIEQENVPENKLNLIYNGINTIDFSPNLETRNSIRNSLDITTNTIVFVIVANLIPYKAHKDLFYALGILSKKISNWKLLCIGSGTEAYTLELKKLATNLNIYKNIIWLGSQPHVESFLQAADVGVLCSYEEGFSNAIIEGMAAGLPMVVTDVGGNSEAIIHNSTGLIVPPAQPYILSSSLKKLATDQQLREEFSENCLARAQEHFNLQKCVAAYYDAYKNLLTTIESQSVQYREI